MICQFLSSVEQRLANRHGLIEHSADQIGRRSSEGLDQVKAVSQFANYYKTLRNGARAPPERFASKQLWKPPDWRSAGKDAAGFLRAFSQRSEWLPMKMRSAPPSTTAREKF